MLGLPYPGGPEISRLAEQARNNNLKKTITLPRPMIGTPDFDFSFSGLKTAVLYTLRDIGGIEKIQNATKAEIAREFEDAVVDVLSKKKRSLRQKKYKASTVIIGGGVSANNELTKRMTAVLTAEKNTTTHADKKTQYGQRSDDWHRR